MEKLVNLVDFVQKTVNKSATAVENVHKSVAGKPYEVIKAVTPFDNLVDSIHSVQNQVIGGVYDIIRAVNNGLSETTKVLLHRIQHRDKNAEQSNKVWR